jgi:hypothetical protein
VQSAGGGVVALGVADADRAGLAVALADGDALDGDAGGEGVAAGCFAEQAGASSSAAVSSGTRRTVPPYAVAYRRGMGAVLADAVEDAVRRLRRRSPAWWRGARADRVAALVASLAEASRQAAGLPPCPPPLRPDRDEVLADQVAVVGRDLAAAANPETAAAALDDLARCLADVDPR